MSVVSQVDYDGLPRLEQPTSDTISSRRAVGL
jgi:hypothetical protein